MKAKKDHSILSLVVNTKPYRSPPSLTRICGVIVAILAFGTHFGLSQGIWTNGQDAESVLGQLDFVSGQSNQGSATPSDKTLDSPRGIAVDPTTGKVFVSDGSNHRVLRFASLAALQNGAAAEAVLGQPNFTSNASAVTRSRFDAPRGITVNSSGVLWVCDSSNHRVLRFDNASQKGNGANADGVLGQLNFASNSPATTQNGMDIPMAVVEDFDGMLWIADLGNSRVLRFNSAASRADGVNADSVLGQANFTSSEFDSTATTMWYPISLAISNTGTLWVADQGSHRILKFSSAASKSNGAAADGVLGQADFTSWDPGSSDLFSPTGIAVDSLGRLWVCSSNRALRFDDAENKGDGAAADGVLGQPDFTTYESGVDRAKFQDGDIFADGANRIWITDNKNSRVLRFEADRSAERAALNRQISSANRAIGKLKKQVKKALKKKQKAKGKRLKQTLQRKNRALQSLRSRLAAL